MSGTEKPPVGEVAWRDLTVPDAERVRDFYRSVVGWQVQPIEMDGYSDFAMVVPATGDGVAGVCHARGPNADMPPQWIIYIIVEDLDASVERCQAQGGEVVVGPRDMGGARFCVIRDPAGAVAGLYQP